MAYFESVNQLICSQDAYSKFKGFIGLSAYELTGSDSSVSSQHGTQKDAIGWSWEKCASWLRRTSDEGSSTAPSIRLLMVHTRNQMTAKGAIPKWPEPRNSMSSDEKTEISCQVDFIVNVFKATKLPLAGFAAYIKTLLTFARIPIASDKASESEHSTQYYCSAPSWAVVWSFNATIQQTSGVVFYREGDGERRVQEVIKEITRLQIKLDHPLLLAYISTKDTLSRIFDIVHEMNSETLDLVQETGLPIWHWALEQNLPATGTRGANSHTVDRFALLSGKVTNMRFRLKTMQEQIKFISRCNAAHQSTIPSSSFRELDRCKELDDMMQTFTELTAVHLHDLDARSERLINQMTSIAQLASQKDAQIGIALAQDSRVLAVQSKIDNSSMKTIAFVSLFFLPATFVAAFFAMPMFDWNADIHSIVSRQFWIYWAVSVPLTALIFVGWVWWYRSQQRMFKQLRTAGLEDLESQIEMPKPTLTTRSRTLSMSKRGRRAVQAVKRGLRMGGMQKFSGVPADLGSRISSAEVEKGTEMKFE